MINHNTRTKTDPYQKVKAKFQPNFHRNREKKKYLGAESELRLGSEAERDLRVRTVKMTVAERRISRRFGGIVSHRRRSS